MFITTWWRRRYGELSRRVEPVVDLADDLPVRPDHRRARVDERDGRRRRAKRLETALDARRGEHVVSRRPT